MVISQESVVQEYKACVPDTSGSPGSFSREELHKLMKLWQCILDFLDNNQTTELQVNSSLLQHISMSNFSNLAQHQPSDELSDTDEYEEQTRKAWRLINKSESGLRKLGIISSKKNKSSDGDKQLIRLVTETTQDYLNRKMGHHVPLLPEDYFPSFRHKCKETRNLVDVFWSIASAKQHPDIWVHRFLRSNNWDVSKALKSIQDVLKWRASEAVDQLNWEGEVKLGLNELRLGILEIVGHDRLGCPLMYVRVRKIMLRNNQEHVFKRYLVHQFETLQYVTRRHQRVSMLYDFTGFSMENTPFHLVRFLIELGIKQYAECTSILILLVDSWLFENFWNLVKGFLDANLSARIVFAKTIDQVLTFVDKEQLPEELNGYNEFKAGFKLPKVNENSLMFDTVKREQAEKEWRRRVADFDSATRKWYNHFTDDICDHYAAERDKAALALDKAERELGKYTRACNSYRRLGLVDADGCLRLPQSTLPAQ
ncbi:phosphatidylinositol transfer protein csr1 [Coemansia brasiliensis]|uniref:Phosphatidylinositol transfer protein csr1 n=1 Tax=Coemansia brasiliensis TaxID=2650707 RepID=A0A9W8IER4_9FUNG|nr:phosphatidylinositol transfer protein csr1 [Coemansia brasiliensis]